MQQNLFMDLLAHERNGYRRILSADIKYYLSHITKKSIILRTLLFELNVTLTLVFNLTVLLFYRAVRVFLL